MQAFRFKVITMYVQIEIICTYIYIYTLEVQRFFLKDFFRKDYYFSKGFKSTIPRDSSLNGL